MNNNFEPPEDAELQHLYLFFYLIPVLGFFPSLWTLYRGRGVGGVGGAGYRAGEAGEVGGAGEEVAPHPSSLSRVRREKLAVSRLSVTLAFSWLIGYLLLNIGAETSDFLTLRLLVLNSLLTSGYFLVSIWLMVRLASHRSIRLPGFTALAERVFGKR